jgi:hypothetical protein
LGKTAKWFLFLIWWSVIYEKYKNLGTYFSTDQSSKEFKLHKKSNQISLHVHTCYLKMLIALPFLDYSKKSYCCHFFTSFTHSRKKFKGKIRSRLHHLLIFDGTFFMRKSSSRKKKFSYRTKVVVRVRSRFFVLVGHETT